jgi:hypothetical protein
MPVINNFPQKSAFLDGKIERARERERERSIQKYILIPSFDLDILSKVLGGPYIQQYTVYKQKLSSKN